VPNAAIHGSMACRSSYHFTLSDGLYTGLTVGGVTAKQLIYFTMILLSLFARNETCIYDKLQGVSKNDPTCFCSNFVESPPNLIIFGTQIAKMIELCEVYSLSISPNLCQHTAV